MNRYLIDELRQRESSWLKQRLHFLRNAQLNHEKEMIKTVLLERKTFLEDNAKKQYLSLLHKKSNGVSD